MQKNRLLKEIMALDMSLYDLQLYLNTHPNDVRAIALFNQYNMQNNQLKIQYQCLCGPLTPQVTNLQHWDWIKSPWPWEMEVK